MYTKLLLQSLLCAVTVLIVGLLLHVLLGHHALHKDSPHMKKEMMRLSLLLFLTGFLSGILLHLMKDMKTMKDK